MTTNREAAQTARRQIEPSIEEHDLELRMLKEFNKKIDDLIDQTVTNNADARDRYTMLKKEV
jgi:hypothetical protein